MRGSGAHMPVDVERVDPHEVEHGVVAVRSRDMLGVVLDQAAAMKVRAAPASWSEWSFRRSHWETCASAAEHRVPPGQEALEL